MLHGNKTSEKCSNIRNFHLELKLSVFNHAMLCGIRIIISQQTWKLAAFWLL